MRSEVSAEANEVVPSARTINGEGCPAFASRTVPSFGLMVPTTTVTTRSSTRASKRKSSEESTSEAVCPVTA
jgi:hypothetical protein